MIEADGSHAEKAGPCVNFKGLEGFMVMRNRLGGCGTGSGLAKDRAAHALITIGIPKEADYPVQ